MQRTKAAITLSLLHFRRPHLGPSAVVCFLAGLHICFLLKFLFRLYCIWYPDILAEDIFAACFAHLTVTALLAAVAPVSPVPLGTMVYDADLFPFRFPVFQRLRYPAHPEPAISFHRYQSLMLSFIVISPFCFMQSML